MGNKRIRLVITLLLVGFVFAAGLCVAKERFMVIPLVAVVAAGAYLLIFRVEWAMYLMALSTPFSITMTDAEVNVGLSLPSELLMIALTGLFFFRILYDLKIKPKLAYHPVSIAIYLYLFWIFVTSITSEIPLVSFKFLASKIWFITSCYFMVIQLMKKEVGSWVRFFNCYAIGLAVVVLITTAKSLAVGLDSHSMHWIMEPYYNDHTAYGCVLAFFLPLTIGLIFLPQNRLFNKLFYIALSLIFMVGLYCSFSRAAWISFVLAIGVWCIVKLKIKFSWVVAATLLFGGTFYYFADDILYKMSRNSQDSSGKLTEHLQSITNISTDASNVERLNRWNSAFGMIRERPVVGWGPGTYQFVYAPFQKPAYKTIITTDFGDGGNAHSEYIGPCAETGFVGLATVIALVILSLYYGFRTYKKSSVPQVRILVLSGTLALITYFIHGALNNFLDTDKLSLPFWSVFALIVMLNVLTECPENEQKILQQ